MVLPVALLTIAGLLWAGAELVKYRAERAALGEQRQAEIIHRAREAKAGAVKSNEIAADQAAKRMNRVWLIGAWVYIDDLEPSVRNDPRYYCSTDSALQFHAGGRYTWYDEDGEFNLGKGGIRFTKRVRTEFAEPNAKPEKLKERTLRAERKGPRLMIEGGTYARC